MAIVKKRSVHVAQGILHNKNADITNINIDIVIAIKSIGAARSRCRSSWCGRQWKHLIIPLLKESLGIRKEQIASVNILLDGIERRDRPRIACLRLGGGRGGAAGAKVQQPPKHCVERKNRRC